MRLLALTMSGKGRRLVTEGRGGSHIEGEAPPRNGSPSRAPRIPPPGRPAATTGDRFDICTLGLNRRSKKVQEKHRTL
ncbi:hypothetical protein FKM82_030862 [Ascaphus truei]